MKALSPDAPSSPPLPSSHRLLGRLASLREEVRSLAAREQSLIKDLRRRRFQVERQRDALVENQQAELSDHLAELHHAYDEAAQQARQRYEKRRDQVERLANSARRNLPKRIENERSRYLGRLQWRRRNAEAEFQQGIAAFETQLADTRQALEESGTRLAALEHHARRAFGPYGSLRHLLNARPTPSTATATDALAQLPQRLDTADSALRAYLNVPGPGFFRTVPFPALLIVALVAGVGVAFARGLTPAAQVEGGITFAVLAIGIFILQQVLGARGKAQATEAAAALREARAMHQQISSSFDAQRETENGRLQQRLQAELEAVQADWDRVDDFGREAEARLRKKVAEQPPRVLGKLETDLQHRLQRIEAGRSEHQAELEQDTHRREGDAGRRSTDGLREIDAQETASLASLTAEWQSRVLPEAQALHRTQTHPAAGQPEWTPERIASWEPAEQFPTAIRIGEVEIDLALGEEPALPTHPSLQLSDSSRLTIPLALTFPEEGSLLIESTEVCAPPVTGVLNETVLSILAHSPAGKAAFTILDPVGLGQNFAGLMHLADYEETLINRRIWTQRDQIDERLAELNDHIEKVIQMYLRNEYETITQYNAQAGSIAEKYHFLVIADFPANFSETAAQKLQSIIVSGPRCGVFTLMHWNTRQAAPDGFHADELRQHSLCLRHQPGSGFYPCSLPTEIAARVHLDAPPPDETALALTHRIGQRSVDSNRVQVPFSTIAPPPDALWQDATTHELRVPIGRTGATKLQYLAIGKGTRQHALFAGKTGSGKSTLFHVIITNLALHCSPEEVEFYLIDFKKGVEFKAYADAQLPHARVIAIESDREFGLSVLQRVDEELKRRGDLFRAAGAQDLAGYKKSPGAQPMPRTLLIIDEFQEFFVEDDTVAQNASVLFDRIVRQGRAFGIHVLLGSQTLGGAYTLARTTMGQMVIRVALQCNESDAALIMDENNPAPRLLTRPGEGIYNDAAGALEGNSPFQVVWIGEDERDAYLEKIHHLAQQRHLDQQPPIVFEGNAPADIAGNHELARALASRPVNAPAAPRLWLGAPNAIKGPAAAVFQRQSGNHLLITGQREEAIQGILGLGLLGLAAQYPKEAARFVFFHGAAPGSAEDSFLRALFPRIPQAIEIATPHDTEAAVTALHDELQSRADQATNDAPPIFVFIHHLHKFKKLRHEDDLDFSFGGDDSGPKPGAMFNTLINEGSSHGIHLIASVDTYNNVARCLSRKALTEFEMRVLFQMSANDSASLSDSTAATNLGLHRAIFHNEQQGTQETFRPYALPPNPWLELALDQINR